jgi:hypothetical protein
MGALEASHAQPPDTIARAQRAEVVPMNKPSTVQLWLVPIPFALLLSALLTSPSPMDQILCALPAWLLCHLANRLINARTGRAGLRWALVLPVDLVLAAVPAGAMWLAFALPRGG